MRVSLVTETAIHEAIAGLEDKYNCSIGWKVSGEYPEIRSASVELNEMDLRADGWKILGEHLVPPTDEGIVYFLRRPDGVVKIGFTENFAQRRSNLQAACGRMDLIRWFIGNRKHEAALHAQFGRVREHNEFFRLEDFPDWEEHLCPYYGCYVVCRRENAETRDRSAEYIKRVGNMGYCSDLVWPKEACPE